jgi:hypothetical protein
MMMIETVQHACAQEVMPDFEELKKLTEDYGQERVLRQEIANIREIHREKKRDPELRNRILRGDLSRRRARHMNLDEIYRMPSLFTWRY